MTLQLGLLVYSMACVRVVVVNPRFKDSQRNHPTSPSLLLDRHAVPRVPQLPAERVDLRAARRRLRHHGTTAAPRRASVVRELLIRFAVGLRPSDVVHVCLRTHIER